MCHLALIQRFFARPLTLPFWVQPSHITPSPITPLTPSTSQKGHLGCLVRQRKATHCQSLQPLISAWKYLVCPPSVTQLPLPGHMDCWMWTTASLSKQAGWTRIDYNIFVILFRWKWGRWRRAPKGLLNPVGPLYRLVAQITLPLHMLLLSNTMEPKSQTLQSSLFLNVSNVTCFRNVFHPGRSLSDNQRSLRSKEQVQICSVLHLSRSSW